MGKQYFTILSLLLYLEEEQGLEVLTQACLEKCQVFGVSIVMVVVMGTIPQTLNRQEQDLPECPLAYERGD